MYKQSFKLFLCLIISSMCLLTDVYARDKNTLVIGKVSADLDARDRQAAKLLADSLLPDLKEEGIEKTEVLLTENITDMLHALKSGEVDWVSDNLFVALVLAEKTRSQVFYSNTREINKINTVFFVRKNSVLNSINNLEKRIVLFSDPLSSNGYFVPFYELTSHGYTPKVYGSEEAAISGEKNVFFIASNLISQK